MTNSTAPNTSYDTALAIIGMAGRFPGAVTVEQFWQNLARGVKSIRFFSDAELLAAGVDPALLRRPNYVKAGGILAESDLFDAAFFGYTRREAEVMDPQHRLFMECAWEALEDAAYNLETYAGLVGVFAGSAFSTYLSNNLHYNDRVKEQVSKLQVDLGNEHDSLASAVSYKFNLKGPSVALQTFCSTSLVAVHMACQSLFTYECDMALAGGVAIATPQVKGYLYEEGGILSPDGECRAFDARGQGCVMGNGAGVVVLKRFHEAVEDGDHIYAVIRGSAINNDGGTRVSYSAPGLNGQKEVIAEALGHAGVDAGGISYLEAHGTATKLGDAVELAAMIKAFEARTPRKRFCAIGSVKPNVGHLDRASGITGLIKTTLALQHKQLPPSLNFEHTHPDIDLDNSPFYVNTALRDWPNDRNGEPRRAGVSSFGLGGTNAHVILEEASECESAAPSRACQLLLLSAKTASALQTSTANLAAHLKAHKEQALADVAYTLQVGRSVFNHRRFVVCRDREEAIDALEACASLSAGVRQQVYNDRPVAFLFSGTEEHIVKLMQEFYQLEPAFRETVDRCRTLLNTRLRRAIDLSQPEMAPIARFVFEYALAQLFSEWGIRPCAVTGSGAGEYAAACVAGIFSLEDALALTAYRSQLPSESVPHLILHKPQIPVLSGAASTWLTDQQAMDQQYWIQLSAHTEYHADCFEWLSRETEPVLLEIGASQSFTDLLTTLGNLWLAGVNIDWTGFYTHEHRRRVSLPAYPFERERYWIDPPEWAAMPWQRARPAPGKTSDIADWFYLPAWRQIPMLTAAPQQKRELSSPYLVFVDACGIGEQVAGKLVQDGYSVLRVRPGEQFARPEPDVFTIRPGECNDYLALCCSLADSGQFPKTILHCWSITPEDEMATGADSFRVQQETGFYSLLFLAQSLGLQSSTGPLRIVVASNDMQAVTGQEWSQPEKATLLGVCKVISQEYLHITCRSVDLSLSEYPGSGAVPDAQLVDRLLAELNSSAAEPAVAYRNDQRWMLSYEAGRLEAVGTQDGKLRQRGVYLITGGLGRVGLTVAAYLARTVQARLVLLGRTALPERSEWAAWLESHETEDRVSVIIRRVQAIEALGAEVLMVQADVADAAQVVAVIEQAHRRFGALHGVIHAAGISGEAAYPAIQQLDHSVCEQHFQPKVYGLYALEQALANRDLDFCLLFSSISSVLGGLGFAAYASANCFMDAFVHRHNRQKAQATAWISINWDTWQHEGMPRGVSGLGSTVAGYAMTPEEGTKSMARILTSDGQAQVVISTGNIQERIRQWVLLESLRDRDNLESNQSNAPALIAAPARGDYERILSEIWRQTLGIEQVGLNDNFFDLGGNSLSGLQVMSKIRKVFRIQIPVVALFEAPTISAMAAYLQPTTEPAPREQRMALSAPREQARRGSSSQEIAIIGMAGRFPGATSIEQFWQNLRSGVESIRFFSDEELLAAGVDPALLRDPNYVKARPILDDVEHFDAAFFGYSPREAELLDPQHRLFLECCWEALEDAAYDPQSYEGLIGVFGGANVSSYLHALMMRPELVNSLDGLVNDQQVAIGTDRDSLTTSVSYKLNLRGPSYAVQTFCSTSLVAVHLACQSLRQGECDMALAGGVSVRVPTVGGHLYQPGGMESPDGHVRTFDAQAKGSLFGDGVGVVVLKRLADALADGDQIAAVIKGSALNNDGSLKVSYTAPSVAGQAQVVSDALAQAGVEAESISYVEAHGTATELGDPIEVAALTKAYREQTPKVGYCAIGSVKTNVGHLDRAAGVSGLIKTVLALNHEELPPSLHYRQPNPQIDFAQSPFYVNATLAPWKRGPQPRRAGLNSLGMGGTNVHLILEEAPEQPVSGASRPWQLLLLSAKTETALEARAHQLRAYLEQHEASNLADVAYTLQVGRSRMAYRRVVLCRDRQEAIAALSPQSEERDIPLRLSWQSHIRVEQRVDRPVAFLLPGVGEQYPGMARELYLQEETFRLWVDRCRALLKDRTGQDLCEALCLNGDQVDAHCKETAPAAAFTVEYALARLFMRWGIRLQTVFGSGSGAYVAACLSGKIALEDALTRIARDALCDEYCDESKFASELSYAPDCLLLEFGSGQMLSSLIERGITNSWLTLPVPSTGYERQSAAARLLMALGKLWLAGVSIDWAAFYGSERRRRLSLPTYPFERQHYWLIPEKLAPLTFASGAPADATASGEAEKAADITDWFYVPSWKQVALPQSTGFAEPHARRWLFFLDEYGIGQKIVDRLRDQGQEVITVTPGAAFYHYGEMAYSVAPADLADYEALLKQVRNWGREPWHIVHMWMVGEEQDSASLEERGFYSLLALAQALGNLGIENCKIDMLSSEMQDVTGSETLCPEKSLLIGPCKVIPQEYPGIHCRSIDIALPVVETRQEDMLIQRLVDELLADSDEVMVALRGRHRWIQAFEMVMLKGQSSDNPFRERGVYLITGGLGGIGLALAEHLARTVRASLVLTARGELPPRSMWDDILKLEGEGGGLCLKIRKVRELESLGAEVLVLQADVTDEARMAMVIQQTLARFGTLHGVLHTAGVPASGLIQRKMPAAAASVLAPKAAGTRVLERVLSGLSLDFLALFSSLSSTTGGGPGQADYCAANAFLDAYAQRHAACYGTTIAIDWGEWQWDAWDAGLAGYPPEAQAYFKERRRKFGIQFEEGIEALRRILLSKLPRVVVCTEDFPAMVEGSKHFSSATILEEIRKVRQSHPSQAISYSRRSLETPFAPPQDEVEREIATIWEELLGIEQVGIHDNFFELGGNSLMGMQLIGRLRRAFQVDVRLLTLFEAPTIAELAVEVEILLIDEIRQSGEPGDEEAEVCIPEMNF